MKLALQWVLPKRTYDLSLGVESTNYCIYDFVGQRRAVANEKS